MKIINRRLKLKQLLSLLVLLLGLAFIFDGASIYAKAHLAQYLISNAWEQTINGQQKTKPWPWADTWPVARLQVEDKDVDLYILSGANGASLPFGPGHVSGTDYPGEAGSSIVAAHRDTHFHFLKDIQLGDTLQIQNQKGVISHYKISQVKVVDSQQNNLQNPEQAQQLTLVTCYPFNSINPGGPLRYVVTADKQIRHKSQISVNSFSLLL